MTEYKDVVEIVEGIKGLTVLDLNKLVKCLEEEFGVSAVAAAMVGAAGGAGGAAEVEKSEFDVVVAEVGNTKMALIKAVKDLTGVGLKEAKALVDGFPGVVKAKVPDAEAQEMKAKLEEAGAKVELK